MYHITCLPPTTPVLKAGHLVSCSSLCMLWVVCLVCIVWLGFWVSFYRFLASVLYTCFSMCIFFGAAVMEWSVYLGRLAIAVYVALLDHQQAGQRSMTHTSTQWQCIIC